jgi:ornithine decarboxylase
MSTKQTGNSMQKLIFNPQIVDIAARHSELKTPFMLTDLDTIVRNCVEFKTRLPGVSLYYAVKALNSKEIIQAMADYVDGFDVASTREIDDLVSFGVDVQKLNFSNPVKSPESIEYASKLGIRNFTFQSRAELEKIQQHAPGSSVHVRVKMNDSKSVVPLSEKFGCLCSEAVDLLKYAQTLGLKPLGVAFHIGSQLLSSSAWQDAINAANAIIDEAHARGLESCIVNIGGGFPARYFESDTTLEETAKTINAHLKKDSSIDYVAEPGRYIVADSSVIVSKVIGVEERNGKKWLFIDTGVFQSFLGATRYDVFPYGPILLKDGANAVLQDSDMASYVVTGPTCDSYDVVVSDVTLPKNIEVGDLLAFPNTGAYTIVYGSAFNGFRLPDRYYMKAGALL